MMMLHHHGNQRKWKDHIPEESISVIIGRQRTQGAHHLPSFHRQHCDERQAQDSHRSFAGFGLLYIRHEDRSLAHEFPYVYDRQHRGKTDRDEGQDG